MTNPPTIEKKSIKKVTLEPPTQPEQIPAPPQQPAINAVPEPFSGVITNLFEHRATHLTPSEQVSARELLNHPVMRRLIEVVQARTPEAISDEIGAAKDPQTVSINAGVGKGWKRALAEIWTVATEENSEPKGSHPTTLRTDKD